MATNMNIKVYCIDDYEMIDADSNVRFEVDISYEDKNVLRQAWDKIVRSGKFAVEFLNDSNTFAVKVRDGEVKSRSTESTPDNDKYFVDELDVLSEILTIIKG